jgi:hypothetical protein
MIKTVVKFSIKDKCFYPHRAYYFLYVVDGQPGNLHQPQEGELPQEKVKIYKLRRIVKKAMRNQPNSKAESG